MSVRGEYLISYSPDVTHAESGVRLLRIEIIDIIVVYYFYVVTSLVALAVYETDIAAPPLPWNIPNNFH